MAAPHWRFIQSINRVAWSLLASTGRLGRIYQFTRRKRKTSPPPPSTLMVVHRKWHHHVIAFKVTLWYLDKNSMLKPSSTIEFCPNTTTSPKLPNVMMPHTAQHYQCGQGLSLSIGKSLCGPAVGKLGRQTLAGGTPVSTRGYGNPMSEYRNDSKKKQWWAYVWISLCMKPPTPLCKNE